MSVAGGLYPEVKRQDASSPLFTGCERRWMLGVGIGYRILETRNAGGAARMKLHEVNFPRAGKASYTGGQQIGSNPKPATRSGITAGRTAS